jgi:hypothetical protein
MVLGSCERAELQRCRERRRRERRWGTQKPLAACQGKTVLLDAVGRSVLCGLQRPPAVGSLGSGRRWAGGPGPWAAQAAL